MSEQFPNTVSPRHILADLESQLGFQSESIQFSEVDGGHMAYQKLFAHTPDGNIYFIKGYDPVFFTDQVKANHSVQYLQKEQALFTYLQKHDFRHVPAFTHLSNDSTLIMDAMPAEQGWAWSADEADDVHAYVTAALSCFDDLQRIPIAPEDHFFPQRIMQIYMEEGWDALDSARIMRVQDRLQTWMADFHPETQAWAAALVPNIAPIVERGRALYDVATELHLCHHDARQANFAWHPEYGISLIDWSWADVGFKNADSTMLLIDLAKSGHDISAYLQHFNPQHALLLMGHWLGRSVEPTRDGDLTVRFHQLTSAVTAYKLLQPYLQTTALE